MPVFVSTTFTENNRSVTEPIRLLVENGISCIELGSTHCSEDNLAAKLKAVNARYITHNFFPPQTDRIVLNIASDDDLVRSNSLAFVKGAIEFAETIGASLYTVHPGFLVDPSGESKTSKSYDFDFPPVQTPRSQLAYEKCFARFKESMREISRHLAGKNVSVAIETQGSVRNKHAVIFSKPEDFSVFSREIATKQIGINLNLAHLDLAANAWGFDKFQVVKELKPMVFAVEVSHNDGTEDQHLLPHADGWYIDVLKEGCFRDVPVVIEARNARLADVVRSYEMVRRIID